MNFMQMKNHYLRPETNNLRRIFVEMGFESMTAMARRLGENPCAFRKYFRLNNPVVPQIDKLEKWVRILNLELAEFFIIGEPIVWPRPLKPHASVHKKGLSYREANALRDSLRTMVAEDRIDAEKIRWFIENK